MKLGPFYCRALEMDNIKAQRLSNGNYDASVKLSNEAKKELSWWITNTMFSLQHIHGPDPDITIYTDSSTLEWGVTDGKNPSGGRWKADEINHVNVLELKAIFTGAQTYCKRKNYRHVRVMSDNITAVSYVNNKGGIKSEFCNKLQKSYGSGVHHKICGYQLHTFLEHKIRRQTVFLENSMRLLSRN